MRLVDYVVVHELVRPSGNTPKRIRELTGQPLAV